MKLNSFVSFFCFLIISCDLPNEADADCAGVNNGTAKIDDCGVCSGGTTEIISNSNKDCNDECFGDAVFDECGACGLNQIAENCSVCDNLVDPIIEADCNSNCPPEVEYDECEVCGGNNECDCPGFPEGTLRDCIGVCGGDTIIDECGLCGGSGIPEENCDCFLNTLDGCEICDGPGFIECMCDYSDSDGDVSSTQSISTMPYAEGDQLTTVDINVEFTTCYPSDCEDTLSLTDFDGRVFWIVYEEDW